MIWRAALPPMQEVRLTVHGDFIVGLPGETRDTIRTSINFAKELDVDTIQVSIAHPYPGTEFYDHVKKNGLITIDSMTDESRAPASQLQLSWLGQGRVGGMGGAILRRILFPAEGGVPLGEQGDLR